ncbi:MAG: hypothetical protein KC636_06085 [Myxococcales bacterium]|nr:hypothetical protein [Myxococcales bacterium]
MRITIDHLWSGQPAEPGERVHLELSVDGGDLRVDIDAPLHRDPPPPAPIGATPGLWEFEVVELFLLGAGARYLELEFGPSGHWLALTLCGPRNVIDHPAAIEFPRPAVLHDRWQGRARVPRAALPEGLSRWNAHAIHGQGAARRYLSAIPAGGLRPDFHQLDVAAPLAAELRARLAAVD